MPQCTGDKHQDGTQHFPYGQNVDINMGIDHPQVYGVIDEGICGSHKEVHNKHHEVTMILVSHTAAYKEAVMVSFQYTAFTDRAVPTAWRSQATTFLTISPSCRYSLWWYFKSDD